MNLNMFKYDIKNIKHFFNIKPLLGFWILSGFCNKKSSN